MITLVIVKALIKDELGLADCPVTETFYNLGFDDQQLQRIQQRINKTFNVSVIPQGSHSVISYTEKLLNEKLLIPSPERTVATAKQDPLI